MTKNWDGGILPSVSLEGSKPGYVIAATWATMMHKGREGYKANSKRITDTVERMVKTINEMPTLFIQGTSDAMVVAFGCSSPK